jgi:hypothetical protein
MFGGKTDGVGDLDFSTFFTGIGKDPSQDC